MGQVAEHKTGKTLRVQSPLAQADLAALLQARVARLLGCLFAR
jgi:hypothetical protein